MTKLLELSLLVGQWFGDGREGGREVRKMDDEIPGLFRLYYCTQGAGIANRIDPRLFFRNALEGHRCPGKLLSVLTEEKVSWSHPAPSEYDAFPRYSP